MTILDLILAVQLCWLTFLGWKKGVVREAATLAGIIAGIWAAVHLSQWVSTLLKLTGESAILIAFFITFVGVLVLVYLLGRSLERLLKTVHLTLPNKIVGALLGIAKALCVLAVVLNGIVLLDRQEKIIPPATKEKSLLYKPVYNTGNLLVESLKDYLGKVKSEHPEGDLSTLEREKNVAKKGEGRSEKGEMRMEKGERRSEKC